MPMQIAPVVFALAAFLILPVLSPAQAAPTTAEASTIACRALEAHTDDELKVTVIVFHQRDEAQRAPLATLLRERSGAMVEVQGTDGSWRRARLVRLKSCFGGLLMLPDAAPFPDRAEFALRLPPK